MTITINQENNKTVSEWRRTNPYNQLTERELVEIFRPEIEPVLRENILETTEKIEKVKDEMFIYQEFLRKYKPGGEDDFTSIFWEMWLEEIEKQDLRPLGKRLERLVRQHGIAIGAKETKKEKRRRITKELIERIKNEVRLEDVAQEYISNLRSCGDRLYGKCPFHAPDRRPSFNVYKDENTYHCFGCQTHGSVIDFVMAIERLDFEEAVETLRVYQNI